jgi:hypothetical protein
MSHTPGPWTRGNVDYTEDNIFGANGVLVAAVCGNDGSNIAVPEVDADARLIAAAPEMLDVLKRFVDMMDKGAESRFWGELDMNARAAIRKAEGGR